MKGSPSAPVLKMPRTAAAAHHATPHILTSVSFFILQYPSAVTFGWSGEAAVDIDLEAYH
jgi:hypothetical protein